MCAARCANIHEAMALLSTSSTMGLLCVSAVCKDPQEKKKERKTLLREKEKKREILGLPTLRAPGCCHTQANEELVLELAADIDVASDEVLFLLQFNTSRTSHP